PRCTATSNCWMVWRTWSSCDTFACLPRVSSTVPRIAIAANANTITVIASTQPQLKFLDADRGLPLSRDGIDCGTADFGGIGAGPAGPGGPGGVGGAPNTSVAGSAAVAMTCVSLASKPGAVNRRSGCGPPGFTSGSLSGSGLITTVSVSGSGGTNG